MKHTEESIEGVYKLQSYISDLIEQYGADDEEFTGDGNLLEKMQSVVKLLKIEPANLDLTLTNGIGRLFDTTNDVRVGADVKIIVDQVLRRYSFIPKSQVHLHFGNHIPKDKFVPRRPFNLPAFYFNSCARNQSIINAMGKKPDEFFPQIHLVTMEYQLLLRDSHLQILWGVPGEDKKDVETPGNFGKNKNFKKRNERFKSPDYSEIEFEGHSLYLTEDGEIADRLHNYTVELHMNNKRVSEELTIKKAAFYKGFEGSVELIVLFDHHFMAAGKLKQKTEPMGRMEYPFVFDMTEVPGSYGTTDFVYSPSFKSIVRVANWKGPKIAPSLPPQPSELTLKERKNRKEIQTVLRKVQEKYRESMENSKNRLHHGSKSPALELVCDSLFTIYVTVANYWKNWVNYWGFPTERENLHCSLYKCRNKILYAYPLCNGNKKHQCSQFDRFFYVCKKYLQDWREAEMQQGMREEISQLLRDTLSGLFMFFCNPSTIEETGPLKVLGCSLRPYEIYDMKAREAFDMYHLFPKATIPLVLDVLCQNSPPSSYFYIVGTYGHGDSPIDMKQSKRDALEALKRNPHVVLFSTTPVRIKLGLVRAFGKFVEERVANGGQDLGVEMENMEEYIEQPEVRLEHRNGSEHPEEQPDQMELEVDSFEYQEEPDDHSEPHQNPELEADHIELHTAARPLEDHPHNFEPTEEPMDHSEHQAEPQNAARLSREPQDNWEPGRAGTEHQKDPEDSSHDLEDQENGSQQLEKTLEVQEEDEDDEEPREDLQLQNGSRQIRDNHPQNDAEPQSHPEPEEDLQDGLEHPEEPQDDFEHQNGSESPEDHQDRSEHHSESPEGSQDDPAPSAVPQLQHGSEPQVVTQAQIDDLSKRVVPMTPREQEEEFERVLGHVIPSRPVRDALEEDQEPEEQVEDGSEHEDEPNELLDDLEDETEPEPTQHDSGAEDDETEAESSSDHPEEPQDDSEHEDEPEPQEHLQDDSEHGIGLDELLDDSDPDDDFHQVPLTAKTNLVLLLDSYVLAPGIDPKPSEPVQNAPEHQDAPEESRLDVDEVRRRLARLEEAAQLEDQEALSRAQDRLEQRHEEMVEVEHATHQERSRSHSERNSRDRELDLELEHLKELMDLEETVDPDEVEVLDEPWSQDNGSGDDEESEEEDGSEVGSEEDERERVVDDLLRDAQDEDEELEITQAQIDDLSKQVITMTPREQEDACEQVFGSLLRKQLQEPAAQEPDHLEHQEEPEQLQNDLEQEDELELQEDPPEQVEDDSVQEDKPELQDDPEQLQDDSEHQEHHDDAMEDLEQPQDHLEHQEHQEHQDDPDDLDQPPEHLEHQAHYDEEEELMEQPQDQLVHQEHHEDVLESPDQDIPSTSDSGPPSVESRPGSRAQSREPQGLNEAPRTPQAAAPPPTRKPFFLTPKNDEPIKPAQAHFTGFGRLGAKKFCSIFGFDDEDDEPLTKRGRFEREESELPEDQLDRLYRPHTTPISSGQKKNQESPAGNTRKTNRKRCFRRIER